MNIQSGSILTRRPSESHRESVRWGVLFMAGLIVSAVLVIPNFYIYLNQQISSADKEMRRIRTELAGVEREIDSCRLQYETYSAWPHIRESLQKFQQPLRQSTPGQCRRLPMVPPSLAPSVAIRFRDLTPQQLPVAKVTAAERRSVSARRIPYASGRRVRN